MFFSPVPALRRAEFSARVDGTRLISHYSARSDVSWLPSAKTVFEFTVLSASHYDHSGLPKMHNFYLPLKVGSGKFTNLFYDFVNVQLVAHRWLN